MVFQCELIKLCAVTFRSKLLNAVEVNTADSQFGFKQAHRAEMAIFALKQTVDFYRKQGTPVYMCYLDAKKHLIELIIGL